MDSLVCLMHQQNQVNLDSLDRAVQRSIEPQKLQKGALLYSSAQYPTKSVQLCVGLSLSVGLYTELVLPRLDLARLWLANLGFPKGEA